jgi:hypothetical protein
MDSMNNKTGIFFNYVYTTPERKRDGIKENGTVLTKHVTVIWD